MPRPIAKPPKRRPQPAPTPETVDPIWLIKAIAATIAVAMVCGYLALCLLFYQGQWQLVLHPTRTSAAAASIDGTPYQLLHFGPDDSAIPQLTGWWIPAQPTANARYADITILFLPPGDGSLSNSIPTLSALHTLGLNIFAFDYRGYGQSANTHPNQQKMTHDVDSAWQYLTDSRAIAANHIIPYGVGAGASLAANLAAAHPAIPALILDSPHTDLLATARRDPRSGLIPTGLLFHENFPLASPLKTLHTPKLLLFTIQSPAAYTTAAEPRTIARFSTLSDPLYTQSIASFLDQYIAQSAKPVPPGTSGPK
ncbi:alpha/beta hydrolase [Edaphobacter paludis]|uniref:Alpha/beta hydrolase n=1 Tax=Edaphobacter paludis TaxID=3035702 RepID=A0AAU7DCV9_9BACT